MINLLVTLNSNYIPPLTVMLRSLMLADPAEEFTVFVAHSSLTASDIAAVEAAVDLSRTKICPIEIDPQLMNDAPVLKRITKETYYRLLATDYLPQELDRVLYIDPDTLIIKSIKDFYNIDFGGCAIAGATHVFGPVKLFNLVRLGLPASAKYLNAGILMMNLELMRKSYSVQDIFEFIRKNTKKLMLGDQDVINALYGTRAIELSSVEYNCDEKICFYKQLKLDDVRRRTVIIHYNGKHKPWKPKYKGIMKPIWDEYATQKGQKNAV